MLYTVLVDTERTWKVFVLGHSLRNNNSLLTGIPEHLDHSSLERLLSTLDSSSICPGYGGKYIDMAKSRDGILRGKDGEVRASIDQLNDAAIIRTVTCEMLTDGSLCTKCKEYSSALRALYSKWVHKNQTVSKFTNDRFLDSHQKEGKIKLLKERASVAEKEVKRLQQAIHHLTSSSGICVESSLHQDLLSIMTEKNGEMISQFPEGSFRRLFWDQQLLCAQQKDARQMRWHPTMIRCVRVQCT